jgi:hypothetical protein
LAGADLAHRRRGVERLRAFGAGRLKLKDSHFAVVAQGVIKMAGLNINLAAHREFCASGGIGSSHFGSQVSGSIRWAPAASGFPFSGIGQGLRGCLFSSGPWVAFSGLSPVVTVCHLRDL